MNNLFPHDLIERIQHTGIVAVVTIDDADDAVPLAHALLEGGVDCIELTLRTEAALSALKRISIDASGIIAGVGTILTPGQAEEAASAGAAFGVAPGMNPNVVRAAGLVGLPFAPGVTTPSDIEQALEHGCRVLKFFPAEPMGGLQYLKCIAAPYAHLGLRFIPLGALKVCHIKQYLADPIIAAIGGSWIAPRDLVRQKNWRQITMNAREAAETVRLVRKGDCQ